MMRAKRTVPAVIAGALLVAGLAACGGAHPREVSDNQTPPATVAISPTLTEAPEGDPLPTDSATDTATDPTTEATPTETPSPTATTTVPAAPKNRACAAYPPNTFAHDYKVSTEPKTQEGDISICTYAPGSGNDVVSIQFACGGAGKAEYNAYINHNRDTWGALDLVASAKHAKVLMQGGYGGRTGIVMTPAPENAFILVRDTLSSDVNKMAFVLKQAATNDARQNLCHH